MSARAQRLSLLIGILVLTLTPVFLLAQKTTVTVSQEIIPTYPFGDPDPIAITYKRPELYPYFRFDGYSATPIDQKWTVVTLENEHIRVTLLPEQGGKIWGAFDKKTGFDFIYRNRVMKFRDIALRGPWTSGGIEFNFGLIGHTPATATPVDYITHENPDGSASVTVGSTDWVSGTDWRVTVSLKPDEAFFTTKSAWFNPTPHRQSYYHWMNAAMHDGDSLRFYIPGDHYIGHDGELDSWPVNEEDVDMSWYQNHTGAYYSHHVLGKTNGGYALYWHDKNLGAGHYSSLRDLPGQKIWTWGLSGAGAIWEGLLTDEDGQYIEAQSGRLYNQAALKSGFNSPFGQSSFGPHGADTWQDIWFPIGSIGGVTKMSPLGALFVETSRGTLALSFSALKNVNETLIVRQQGHEVHREEISLEARETWKTRLFPFNLEEDFDIMLGEDLEYSSAPEADFWSRPITQPVGFDPNSPETTLHKARQHDDLRQYKQAEELYFQILAKNPFAVDALVRLGAIYLKQGRTTDAWEKAGTALSVDAYHPEANFIAGVAARELGLIPDARESFSWAARDPGYRSAAWTEWAVTEAQRGKWSDALTLVQRALDYNRYNRRAQALQAVILRVRNHPQEAATAVDQLLEIDPLYSFAWFEKYVLSGDSADLRRFKDSINGELPAQSYLQTAHEYISLNRIDEAVSVLSEGPESPVNLITLAYMKRESDPTASADLLEKAFRLDPVLVFPSRPASLPILTWAMRSTNHWKARYYLALLSFSLGNSRYASGLLDVAGPDADADVFFLNRAMIRRDLEDAEGQEADLIRAKELNPSQWRTWHLLFDLYRAQGKHAKALDISAQGSTRFPDNGRLRLDYSIALLNMGKHENVLPTLIAVEYIPFEGFAEAHLIYERAHLYNALSAVKSGNSLKAAAHIEGSMLYPTSLGVGEPPEVDHSIQDYMRLRLGTLAATQLDQSRERLARAASELNPADHSAFLYALLLRHEGMTVQANRLLEMVLLVAEKETAELYNNLWSGADGDAVQGERERFNPISVLTAVVETFRDR